MADPLHVALVSVEREIWSGESTEVLARTVEGELGILPRHAPLLGQLADGGVVEIRREDGDPLTVAAHGGFLSVSDDGVSILAETAELAEDIDTERARQALERARSADSDDPEMQAAEQRALSRLRAAGEQV